MLVNMGKTNSDSKMEKSVYYYFMAKVKRDYSIHATSAQGWDSVELELENRWDQSLSISHTFHFIDIYWGPENKGQGYTYTWIWDLKLAHFSNYMNVWGQRMI